MLLCIFWILTYSVLTPILFKPSKTFSWKKNENLKEILFYQEWRPEIENKSFRIRNKKCEYFVQIFGSILIFLSTNGFQFLVSNFLEYFVQKYSEYFRCCLLLRNWKPILWGFTRQSNEKSKNLHFFQNNSYKNIQKLLLTYLLEIEFCGQSEYFVHKYLKNTHWEPFYFFVSIEQIHSVLTRNLCKTTSEPF